MNDSERSKLLIETRDKLEMAKRKCIKAEAGMESVLKDLKQYRGCNSLEEAKDKLAEKEAALQKAQKKLDALIEEFKASPLFKGDE